MEKLPVKKRRIKYVCGTKFIYFMQNKNNKKYMNDSFSNGIVHIF